MSNNVFDISGSILNAIFYMKSQQIFFSLVALEIFLKILNRLNFGKTFECRMCGIMQLAAVMCGSVCGGWETWLPATAALKYMAHGRTRSPLHNIKQKKIQALCLSLDLFSILIQLVGKVLGPCSGGMKDKPVPMKDHASKGTSQWMVSRAGQGLHFLLLGEGIRVLKDNLKNTIM